MEYKLKNIYTIGYVLALILLITLIYHKSIALLADEWMNNDAYSHGPILVIVALYILWKKRLRLLACVGEASWSGPLVIFIGLALAVGAIQGDIVKAINYSLIVVLLGLVLSIGGRRLLKETLFPLFLLFMTIPLPYLVNVLLTRKLQFISSELGAWFIELFNIPIYLNGNVIELQNYTLLVEEACSGLNYLYALVSIGIIWSYFLRVPRWHKALLVFSTIPIAVFMNGARVGVTGVLVHFSGIEVAEGFMHEFEGMLVFLATCLLLIPVVWLPTMFQKNRPSLSQLFDFNLVSDSEQNSSKHATVPPAALVGLALLGVASLLTLNESGSVVPQRASFSSFPATLGNWTSSTENLPAIIQDVLKADDYYLADFDSSNGNVINLYMVYYKTQFRQKAVHSPLVCLPGSGWVIDKEQSIDIAPSGGKKIHVKRLIIAKEGNKQLVYYWIQQQGKSFSNDFAARISLIGNALLSKRSDSALIRLTTPILDGDIRSSENILNQFLVELYPKLDRYFPN